MIIIESLIFRTIQFSNYAYKKKNIYIKNPIDNFWNVCAHERLVWLSCCTDDTSPDARMRTFSRCVSHSAHFIQRTCIGLRCLRDSVCLSKIIPSGHHITPGCSWVLCFPSCLVFVYDTADLNQTKPVRDSALGWTVWPSGRSDSKHRLWAQVLRGRQQRAYADQPSVQKEQRQPGEQRDTRRLRGFWPSSSTFRSKQHRDSVASTVPNPGNCDSVASSFSSTRILVADHETVVGVEESVSRTKSVWTPIDRSVMGKTIRESFVRTWVGQSFELGMSVCSSKTRIILIDVRERHKNGWKEADCDSHLEKLMKNVDLDEPTSFLDHVYLECTQRECKPNEFFITEYTKMFESRISAGATEKIRGVLTQRQSYGLTTWKDMLENTLSDTANW